MQWVSKKTKPRRRLYAKEPGGESSKKKKKERERKRERDRANRNVSWKSGSDETEKKNQNEMGQSWEYLEAPV